MFLVFVFFCLKSTISLTFLLGAIKRALGVFTAQLLGRDLMPDGRTFSVSTLRYSSCCFKKKEKERKRKLVSILKQLSPKMFN